MSCSSSSSSSLSPSSFSLLPSSASTAKATFVFFYSSSSSKRFSGIRASRSAYLGSLLSHKRIKQQLNLDVAPVKGARKDCQRARLPTQCFCQDHPSSVIDKSSYPQNADFPRYYSKREKKPFPIPILELRRAARERQKKARGKPRRPMPPPKNGMLVRSLIPVAYEVMNARILLINNLKRLMKVVPVRACKYCNEIHVGQTGHPFKSCRGLHADKRRGLHEWTNATVEDVFLPIEAYHLFDRLGKRISHEERFSIPRVPAIVELCVQAGVDLPDLPTKRRRKPVIRIRKSEIIDADEDDLPDPKPDKFNKPILDEIPDSDAIPPSSAEETASLSEETLEAWDTLRQGTGRLMRKYAVRVCGYCPEVHVGPSGHKAQNCGAFKHQQRNGQHGWQAAVLDDLIPPRFVWHVPATEPELQRELRNFYGQAPAVVELCVQGGARVPEQYKPTMRLDVGIPTNLREAEMVV
ncbi:APO protein 2, chloroplastic [Elaeis guineensis]|uniref:APO protein 2, chloroplastic isoform X1 n=1 Tax=Elaeis guineensis var. tenera TaxID=51953 RepID=A0A6I9R0N7_ELAGV|nr:APO protein 2, chloroplastic isoform X1 [Elaeis guineensis]